METRTERAEKITKALKNRECPECGERMVLIDISSSYWWPASGTGEDRDHDTEERCVDGAGSPDLYWQCSSKPMVHPRWTSKEMKASALAELRGLVDEVEACLVHDAANIVD